MKDCWSAQWYLVDEYLVLDTEKVVTEKKGLG